MGLYVNPRNTAFTEAVHSQIYVDKTGQGFIFIIDEWDCVFRLAKDRSDCQQNYLNFLRGLFKSSDYVNLAYDEAAKETFIPNEEVAQEFLNAVDDPGWDGLIQSLERSESLLKSTWGLDSTKVAKGITEIHNETSSLLNYNRESSLTCTILMAYYSAKAYYMNPIMELPSGKDLLMWSISPQKIQIIRHW